MQKIFNVSEYLAKFNTKQEIKDELARIQMSMVNIRLGRFDLNDRLWQRKRVLLEKYYHEYCTKEYYMDDLGRTHWYWIEIEEWQKAHNNANKARKRVQSNKLSRKP